MGDQDTTSLKMSINALENRLARLESAGLSSGTNQYPINPDAKSKSATGAIVGEQILDIFWNKIYYYTTDFAGLDGYDQSMSTGAAATLFGGAMALSTSVTSVAGDFASVHRTVSASGAYSFEKESRFRTQAFFSSTSAQTIYLVIGSFSGHSYGFKVSGSTLYGVSQTSSSLQSTVNLNTTINTTDLYKLDARFYPKSHVDFYVNDVFKASVSVNLPSTANTQLWEAYIQTTDTTQKGVGIYFIDYIQRRDS